MAEMTLIRTFLAVELERDLRQAIRRTQNSLRQELARTWPDLHLQWVRLESMHLTLKFLGDVEESRMPEIVERLKAVVLPHEPFLLNVERLGVFPDLRAPRVLWVGLAGMIDRLIRLVEAIERDLADIGFPSERKPFSPHITVARIKQRSHEVGKAFADAGLLRQDIQFGTVPVQAVALMKSERHASGSVYSRLGLVGLAQAKV